MNKAPKMSLHHRDRNMPPLTTSSSSSSLSTDCCASPHNRSSSNLNTNGDPLKKHHDNVQSNGSSSCSHGPLHHRSFTSQSAQSQSVPLPTNIPELLLLQEQQPAGLASIPQAVLRQCLEPVLQALAELDAMALLHLDVHTRDAHDGPSGGGPRVDFDGTLVHAIHDKVTPPISSCSASPRGTNLDSQAVAAAATVVRYIHLAEVADQYSMGIFVFPPFATIPLHDHPGMCVLSRILYGDLERMSLDLVADDDDCSGGKDLSTAASHRYPAGTKRARQKQVDYLQAPQVTVLYPLEGNLHEFKAGPHGAAILDVLLPPYNHNRDCTFYHANPIQSSACKAPQQEDGDALMDDVCDGSDHQYYLIIPTGQPEDFHCIGGQYRDIGSST